MESLYLRLSVTERCNLRCVYCRPGMHDTEVEHGTNAGLADREWLDLIEAVADVAPLAKVRLTGGEPLLRPGLHRLVAGLREALPETTLSLTTNGMLLAELAGRLRRAGLDSINVSLDGPDQRSLARATGGARLDRVVRGVEAAREQGFSRLKINAVLLRSVNGDRLERLVALAAGLGCELRFIELMPLGVARAIYHRESLSAPEALDRISRRYPVLERLDRVGTATRYRLRLDEGRDTVVGFITPVSDPFCDACNRIRLDARGRLLSCLRREHDGVDLAAPLRQGGAAAVAPLVREALEAKNLPQPGWPRRAMVAIGG
jgi:cyclic pyranopterin phosphate synthase